MASISQINGVRTAGRRDPETSAALDQIEESAEAWRKDNTGQAVEKARKFGRGLSEGRASAVELSMASARRSQGTKSSLQMIGYRLETIGRKIEKIVDAVALMAVQTTMLAVSGSVEAARAGDAGRGFAIVSSDIRSLGREASQNVERGEDRCAVSSSSIVIFNR